MDFRKISRRHLLQGSAAIALSMPSLVRSHCCVRRFCVSIQPTDATPSESAAIRKASNEEDPTSAGAYVFSGNRGEQLLPL